MNRKESSVLCLLVLLLFVLFLSFVGTEFDSIKNTQIEIIKTIKEIK